MTNESIEELGVKLRSYFLASAEDPSPPSFSKFARSREMTLSELKRYRENENFDRIWLDCIEIRRDYLIDKALTRSCDPSFVKFILSTEDGCEADGSEDGNLNINITVLEA